MAMLPGNSRELKLNLQQYKLNPINNFLPFPLPMEPFPENICLPGLPFACIKSLLKFTASWAFFYFLFKNVFLPPSSDNLSASRSCAYYLALLSLSRILSSHSKQWRLCVTNEKQKLLGAMLWNKTMFSYRFISYRKINLNNLTHLLESFLPIACLVWG